MRDINFRAFWKDKLKPIEDFNINYTIDSCNSKVFIVDQYTGLKDKNGVEIYEGDIVVKEFCDIISQPMLVEYVGHVIEPFNYGNENESTVLPSDCIVIGNIHQNPELLK